MNKITLKKITINNFKGIKSKEIQFSTDITIILGANGTGKTSIFDAFTWCLFGKDSSDKKDFSIKTLDSSNNPIHRLEHSVTCLLDCNGSEEKISRIYTEKWTKKRGEVEETFDGHETVLMINDIVYKGVDFSKYISDIISEDLFKLLTSGTYFQSLKWEKRRELLFSIVPSVTDEEVIGDNKEFRKLVDYLKGTPVETYQQQLKQRISNTKKELDDIPSRIDELNNNIPSEVPQFSALRCELASLESLDSSNDKIITKRKEIEQQIATERKKHDDRYNEANKENIDKRNEKSTIEQQINDKSREIDSLDKQLDTLRNSYKFEASLVYSVGNCPISKKPCNVEGVFTSEAEYNSQKAIKLADINTKGKELKDKKELLVNEVVALKEKSDAIIIKEIPYIAYDDSKLRSTMPELKPTNDRIKEINTILGQEKLINDMNARLEELSVKEKEISEALAALERTEFQVKNFIKEKTEKSVDKINALFSFVSFKLYETQINGVEVPCCETLINGVPYSDANTASRVSAGIDIINVLSKFNDTYCPVFLDNMESCHSPIECNSQSIRLTVDEESINLNIK